MLEKICLPIKDGLDDVEKIISQSVVSNIGLATEVARYTTSEGGKRIRPVLFLLASRMCGASTPKIPSIAAAMELLHTASLLHDDVVDEATLRRGKKSARARWGNHISVLVGDFLWCCASSLILESSSERAMRVVERAVMQTTEGELLEVAHQNDVDLDRETYLRIIGGKTAALFSACGQVAAIVAEVSGEFEIALRDYGFNVGIAFQLTDDILDYETDRNEGKITLPFIEKEGGVGATKSLAREHSDLAKSQLDIFKPSAERDSLTALADYIVDRKE